MNSLFTNFPIPYPLKTLKKPFNFWCFQGVQNSNTGQQWVRNPFLNG